MWRSTACRCVELCLSEGTVCSTLVTELAWMESLQAVDLREGFVGQGGNHRVASGDAHKWTRGSS
jgi:hypothetical protein